MKIKTPFLLLLIALALFISACGDEAKRPVDYPNTEWKCEDGNITFSVNSDGKVENASLTNATGDTVKVSVVFSDLDEQKVSFYSEDGKESYFSGSCTYGEDTFTVTISDVYNIDFSQLPPRLVFTSK